MSRVLIVAYYFPPISTIGAMRPLAFCRHLPAYGWTPRVVTADPRSVTPPLPLDDDLAGRIPAGTRVDAVGHRDPVAALIRLRDRCRSTPPAGGRTASPSDSARSTGTSLLSTAKDLALAHVQLPDPQRWWHGPAVRAALAGDPPDVVFATAGPWTSLLVGRSIARRFRVPFVADFRDPWTRNPFRPYAPSVWRRHRSLEREICSAAARVIVNTPELCRQFVADYADMADKFVTISNGFDAVDDDVREPVTPGDGDTGDRQMPLELWHFGTVYGKRSPTALLRAVDRLAAAAPAGAPRIRIRFVGSWEVDENDEASRLARKLEAIGAVIREPQVPHRICARLMREAEVLLVLQPDSPLQVPGKLYEYIATRRPLVVIGGEGATADLVMRNNLGRCSANDAAAIQQLLEELASGTRPAVLPAAAVAAFDYRRLTGRLADVFAAAMGGRAAARAA